MVVSAGVLLPALWGSDSDVGAGVPCAGVGGIPRLSGWVGGTVALVLFVLVGRVSMSGVLLLSGGVDSLTLLADLVAEGDAPLCLSINYGQRHHLELKASTEIARHYGVRREFLSLPQNALSGSALTCDRKLPQGVVPSDPSQTATVVPGRNAVFAALACALAVREGLASVYLACHAGDSLIYPDCRPDFVAFLNGAFRSAYGVSVLAPFLAVTKANIVRRARVLNAPLHLAYSCYRGKSVPCGVCGACLARQEAGA